MSLPTRIPDPELHQDGPNESASTPYGDVANLPDVSYEEYAEERGEQDEVSHGDDLPPRPKYEYPPFEDPRVGPYYMMPQGNAGEATDIINDPPSNRPTVGGLPPITGGLPPITRITQPGPSDERGKYIAQGLLPDPVMGQLASLPYDPLWMAHNGVDQSTLSAYKSKLKLENMFGKGLFNIGDVLRIVAPSGAVSNEVEAVVTSFPNVSAAYPDFRIHNTTTGASSTLSACKGVSQLYQVMTNQQVVGMVGFSRFRVFRNGQDLGDLSTLRQALEIWIEEKDSWDLRTTGNGRRRRVVKD